MLNTPMSNNEANECKNQADASTQSPKAYYQQPDASEFNFNEALDALVTLIALKGLYMQSSKKKFIELSNKPLLALCIGIPDYLVPGDIKN